MEKVSRKTAARVNAILDEAEEQLDLALEKIVAERIAARNAGDGNTAWFLYCKGSALCRIKAQLEEQKITEPIY